MSRKVLITTSTFAETDSAPLDRLTAAGFEYRLNPHKRKLVKKECLELFPGFDGLIAGLETLDQEVLSASRLKVISRCGAGMSNVDAQAARQLNIKVFGTPDAPTQAFLIEKDSKRFPKTGGWGYALFNHDVAAGKITADPAPADCGQVCHVAVKAKDYIFHPYQKR